MAPSGASPSNRSVPSTRSQPRFAPEGASAGRTSISSLAFCPTSPIHRSPVVRSNEYRHGFRRPKAQISGRAPSRPTNGLSLGMPYGSSARGPRRDPQHLAQERVERLRVAHRIAGAPPVAEPDIEVAVRAEHEVAAVVVRERLLHEQHLTPRAEIGRPVLEAELGDVGVTDRVGEVHVQEPAVRRERQTQQALLAPERDLRPHVQDHLGLVAPVEERDHPPGLLGDVDRVVALSDRERQRLLERRNQAELHTDLAELRRVPGHRVAGRPRRSAGGWGGRLSDARARYGEDDDERGGASAGRPGAGRPGRLGRSIGHPVRLATSAGNAGPRSRPGLRARLRARRSPTAWPGPRRWWSSRTRRSPAPPAACPRSPG